MFNPNRAHIPLRERRNGIEPEEGLAVYTIEDLLNDDQLDFAIDIAKGEEGNVSFEIIVLEFRSN